jgi:hypothetical protein
MMVLIHILIPTYTYALYTVHIGRFLFGIFGRDNLAKFLNIFFEFHP